MEMIDKLRELNKKLDDPYFVKEFEEGFEKFLKERDMKIYHTATRKDYNALMVELESKWYKWLSGDKPTSKDYWSGDKENTCIDISGKDITFASIEWYKKEYQDIPIIEYKAGGANKVEKKCEKCDIEYHDNEKYCSMCGNRLVAETEFKVGDYVVDDGSYLIMKVDEASNSVVCSKICYNFRYFTFRNNFVCETGHLRHATPKEIKEYESALNFHNHGREPFEVKEGDLIKTSSGRNIIAYYSENYSRSRFLKDGWKLLKTVEEINEWIKGE